MGRVWTEWTVSAKGKGGVVSDVGGTGTSMVGHIDGVTDGVVGDACGVYGLVGLCAQHKVTLLLVLVHGTGTPYSQQSEQTQIAGSNVQEGLYCLKDRT